MSEQNTINIQAVFDAPIEKVWNALSNESELKKWFFHVQKYQFELGKTFTFYGDSENKIFFHKCRFSSIVPLKVIEYHWTHPKESDADSIVRWELSSYDGKTKVSLTHTGTEKFADAGPEFSTESYNAGWEFIVKNRLRNYLHGIHTLHFEQLINASAVTVWKVLWHKDSYPRWTLPFCEGTYYEGELKQGNRVHLLDPKGEGMYSDITILEENKVLAFKHIGYLKDKKELPLDEETEKWTGSYETYRLTEEEGKTLLKVDVDVIDLYLDFMNEAFPASLELVKEFSEK